MLGITYTPDFVRQYKSLEDSLQIEIVEKLKLLKNKDNHKSLRVHKLHGKLSDCHSFSINYRIRLVFEYMNKNEIVCHFVGDHDIYK
ncbi:MAG: type II toxin-antitoxin system RelE/ParE family toxin [Candidatus Vogelbacteria bacterium]|nr:type II toxin-antitoxin system RelE/ParE family toxin [Candidatus Vogelbacteria bacterium]